MEVFDHTCVCRSPRSFYFSGTCGFRVVIYLAMKCWNGRATHPHANLELLMNISTFVRLQNLIEGCQLGPPEKHGIFTWPLKILEGYIPPLN